VRRIIAIARKEFLHILRDRRSLAVAILMPLLMVLLYGFAIDMDLKNIRVGILDFSNSSDSRTFIREMVSSKFIVESERLSNRNEIEPGFRQNKYRAVIIFPTDFGTSLIRNPITQIQIILDGADGTSAATVANYLSAVTVRLNKEFAKEDFGIERLPIEIRTRILFNPELKSAHFIVPGLAALIMMMICALLTSIALTREKETGTMEQILTTPVASPQVILGKLFPYMIIASVDATLIFLVGKIVFDVPMNGSWFALAGYSMVFILIALSLGLLISSVAKTQQVALIAALMVTLLPTLLLSGFIFPIKSMPTVLQYVSQIIPATYYLEIIRGIILKGVNWYPRSGGILAGMSLFLIVLSIKRFKTRLD